MGSYFIWTPLLLFCAFQVSDNRNVQQDVDSFIIRTGNSQVDDIISNFPVTIPDGIDPKNINVTSVTIKACTVMKEQLQQLDSQLQQTTVRNSQLEKEGFGLRGQVRQLRLQLAACSATASAITGSYQTQLLKKMTQLLETFDTDTFLILKTITLTREVNSLRIRADNAANSTETISEARVLQKMLQEKMVELNLKIEQIERSHMNSSLIVQIISLQNDIWDLEQAKSRRRDTSLQPDRKIQAFQEQLDRKIRELRAQGDAASAVLELNSVHSKIAMMQRLISIHIEESRTKTDDYQRQWRQKGELLKRKILQLNREENNTNLTREILLLQTEVWDLRQKMSNSKQTIASQLQELRVILENEKKGQENLQKQLEERDYAQAQLIMKILGMMKEVRELQVDEQDQTDSTSQATTLQTLLQTKEREYQAAQAQIKELEKRLQAKIDECSGLEGKYEELKTEFEQNLAELNRTGDSKAALILNVINLHNELKTLKELIATSDDPERILELQRQVQEKKEDLNSKTADIERLIGQPKIVLTIIELQNEIWDLQKKADGQNINELQNRVDDLITKIDDNSEGSTKLMLQVITLQSQVEQLQRQLSDLQTLQTTQATQLRNDLTTKTRELQQYVNNLNEKNQTNTRLILRVTALQNQLRNLENVQNTSSSTMTELREQLKAQTQERSSDKAEIQILRAQLQVKEQERAFAQAEVKELQRRLRSKNADCSGFEERYEQLKTEFEQNLADLNRTGDSKAALILDVMNLHSELKTLRELISSSDDPERISELQRQLEEKQKDLNSRTADIERLIPNPRMILRIIESQNEIWDLEKKAGNGDTLTEMRDRVDGLLSELDNKDNTKLMLQIIALQSEVDHLQRQLSDPQMSQTAQATQLTNDLTAKKKELQKYINELTEKDPTNANFILKSTDLLSQRRNLDKEDSGGQATSATITKLREQLKAKVEEQSREIKALQNLLNQTEAQCSNFEQKIKDLQNDLDAKMKELQSKSDSVTTLALQVSTLTVQLEELKRQLQNTESETKIKELQRIIDEKTAELDKKTEELKARSAQPQRLLHIISIQTEIEKLAYVAANETDYAKIAAHQDHLNDLINGIEDENNENTKLTFQILAQQDEIARLRKQEEKQTKAEQERIKDLENELEDIRNEIKEKTLVLDSSDTRIANLTAQIMELHRKIKPLEDEISYLKEANAENLEELQKKLSLSKRQLQDSERRLQDADKKNFNSIMEIAELRTKLKAAQRQASKASKQNGDEVEQQIQMQQRENRKLEKANKDLKQEVDELKSCCRDASTQCDDLERQFEQSVEDTNHLQQQLNEKDARLQQLELDLDEQRRENNKLQDDYNNLQYEKKKLEDDLQDSQNKLNDVESKTIHTSKVTFDPDTANPRIAISADKTEITTTSEIQDTPDHPGRFNVLLAVLGKTGFSAGRHYWEVSVAGKLCFHIGMASESAVRRGSITFSPAKGFWTVILDKQGNYRALDRRPAVIPVQSQPQSLGVLLDYRKGQISFYDAGIRSHIYTFAGQSFTDKIYPFVNLCVEDAEGQIPIAMVTPGSIDWIQ